MLQNSEMKLKSRSVVDWEFDMKNLIIAQLRLSQTESLKRFKLCAK